MHRSLNEEEIWSGSLIFSLTFKVPTLQQQQQHIYPHPPPPWQLKKKILPFSSFLLTYFQHSGILAQRFQSSMGRQQWKMLLLIGEHGSKITRNVVFLIAICSQLAIKNSFSKDFLCMFIDSINIFDCRLPGVPLVRLSSMTLHLARPSFIWMFSVEFMFKHGKC